MKHLTDEQARNLICRALIRKGITPTMTDDGVAIARNGESVVIHTRMLQQDVLLEDVQRRGAAAYEEAADYLVQVAMGLATARKEEAFDSSRITLVPSTTSKRDKDEIVTQRIPLTADAWEMDESALRDKEFPFCLHMALAYNMPEIWTFPCSSTIKDELLPEDQLFEKAKSNLIASLRKGDFSTSRHDLPSGIGLIDREGAAGIAFVLKEAWYEPWPDGGVVLGMPDRNLLIFAPVKDGMSIQAIQGLTGFTLETFREAQFPAIPLPVWTDGKRWEVVAVTPLADSKLGICFGPLASPHVEPILT